MSAKRFSIAVDHSRDVFLTDFSKQTLKDRYLLPGERYQDLLIQNLNYIQIHIHI
jgi:ribonucleoside-diphosphate reductase alpha chain